MEKMTRTVHKTLSGGGVVGGLGVAGVGDVMTV